MSFTYKTATSTNLISLMARQKRTMIQIIPALARGGYSFLDLNFCEMMNPGSTVDQEYIRTLGRLSKEYELTYVQSHVPYPRDYYAMSPAEQEKSDDLIRRAIEYSIELGVPSIVIHPVRGGIDANILYLSRFAALVEGTGSRLAVENMETGDEPSEHSELLEIIKALPCNAGICLDTGHAHLRGLDIASEIRAYGQNLIATHIADNHQKTDEHLLPFFGSIDWKAVMTAMKGISYQGYMTYECMFFSRSLPLSLEEDVIRLSLKISSELAGLACSVTTA